MNRFLKKICTGILCGVLGVVSIGAQEAFAADAKEMRAVWISTVYSADYPSTTNNAETQKNEFIQKLEQAQALGLNTVVVQVRPKGDALYQSDLNPWSAVLTGAQGTNPGYDPMAFMIAEAHKRGMEFHAWMNPYRITTSGTDVSALSADNMARKHPDWILTYNGAMYYDPANEEVQQYICDTVKEVVEKYYVDAIHFDDYFYPSNYPLPEGETREGAVAQERRDNVDTLIKKVYQTIKNTKASVEFGISPMGIWKNSTSDEAGSATRGSEGYYTVYGDAKKWVEKGWVDYITPQIYWEQGNAYADYETLVKWWATHSENRPLFIGQSVPKTVQFADPQNSSINQLPRKMALQRAYQTIGGSCQWYAAAVVENQGRYRDALISEYHKYPALIPVFDFMDDKAPGKVRKMKKVWTEDGYILFWTAPKADTEMDKAVQYVVYRFDSKEKVNLDDPSHIVAITRNPFYRLPYETGKTKCRYVVTALDRLHNESKSVSKKLKL